MIEMSPKDLSTYRQPLVTSLGIILGFLLNFLAGWATRQDQTSEIQNYADFIVAMTVLPALVIMVFVLYRLLDIRHKPEKLGRIYMNTLQLYMFAIALAFSGVGVALFF